MNKFITIAVLTFFIVGFSVVLFRDKPLYVAPSWNKSAVTNITEQKDLTTMVKFLELAQAQGDYKETGQQHTIFAPTNEAFKKLPYERQLLLSDKENTDALFKTEDNHVVIGYYPTSSFNDGMKLTTVNGEVITITKKDNKWFINGTVAIVEADLEANNGVIHKIDTVLLPKNL